MTPNNEIRKQATNAATRVTALVQKAGLVKVTAGAAIYAAHIRQMDRQRQQQAPQSSRKVRRDAVGREA